MIGFLVLYVCVNVVAGFHTPQAEIAVLLTPKTIEIYNLIINGAQIKIFDAMETASLPDLYQDATSFNISEFEESMAKNNVLIDVMDYYEPFSSLFNNTDNETGQVIIDLNNMFYKVIFINITSLNGTAQTISKRDAVTSENSNFTTFNFTSNNTGFINDTVIVPFNNTACKPALYGVCEPLSICYVDTKSLYEYCKSDACEYKYGINFTAYFFSELCNTFGSFDTTTTAPTTTTEPVTSAPISVGEIVGAAVGGTVGVVMSGIGVRYLWLHFFSGKNMF